MKRIITRMPLLLFIVLNMNPAQSQQKDFGPLVNVAAKVRHRDSAQRIFYDDWVMFPTLLVDNLKGFKPAETKLDSYGGDATITLPGKEFFHVQKVNDRWWCVDPAGHPYVNIVVNSVSTGPSDRNKNAFQNKFATKEKWMESTNVLLHEMGFSGTASWSDTKAVLGENKTARQPLAYAINWDFMSKYGKKRGGTYQVPGHLGYPNNTIFVFDPEFETFANELARELIPYKDDKNLFGYFSDNEMPFSLTNLEGYLTLENKNDPGYRAAKKWIDEKGINEKNLSDQNKANFLAFEAEKYFSVVSAAIKKNDPNHMYIGCRFYSGEKNVPEFMQAAGRWLDIVSINYYGAWTPSDKLMENWAQWSGKPFIITEFYVKAEDSGLPNVSGAGWIVKTQDDRGSFYQNFCMGLLRSKNCVGWHWFKYQDNDPTQKDAEPSNTDANKGIVDNEYNVYRPLSEKMRQLNRNSYALINYFDKK